MHNTLKNMVGQQFGNLVVIKRAECNSKSGNAKWVCLCNCGKEVVVIGSKLRNGHTKSCGCLRESAGGNSQKRLHRIWQRMKKRCFNKDDEHYKWYGARGITVCSEWKNDYTEFERWALKNGYADNLSIDRINSNGNYEPSNCRWVTQKVQCNNVRSNRIVEYQGKKYTVAQFADFLQYDYTTVINRLRLGWTTERIASTPEQKKGEKIWNKKKI